MAGNRFAQTTDLYAFYMGWRQFATPLLCATSYDARLAIGVRLMDAIYLLLLIVLSAGMLGFLLLCDRLGQRK